MKTLTKANIEELAQEIIGFLERSGLASDVSIYFNNKVMRNEGKYDDDYNYISKWETTESVDPHDYFEYAAYDHILSMSFEGPLYDVLNYTFGKMEEKFLDIFHKYGLYYELGNAWNLSAYLSNDNIEVEYTKYERPKKEIHIHHNSYDAPDELRAIMNVWYIMSRITGDDGSCVVGAGFSFEWRGEKYFMSACSPYQRSLSWEAHTDVVKEMLEKVGATKIYYNWGNMD